MGKMGWREGFLKIGGTRTYLYADRGGHIEKKILIMKEKEAYLFEQSPWVFNIGQEHRD